MTLPLMLAGPILRRVEPKLVAVWVALSRPATVKLSLYQGMKVGAAAGIAHAEMATPVAARRIGKKLFVALATLKITAAAKVLQPGVNYAYDLAITEPAVVTPHTLNSLGLLTSVHQPGVTGVNHEALGYLPGLLPSFALPPAELTDLRIVYGSCRRVCNEHADAMVWIDTLIDRARPPALVGNPNDAAALQEFALKRPHQLFLGGDQIYADDVSPMQLHMCNRLGHELLSDPTTPEPNDLEKLFITGTRKKSSDARRPRFAESLDLGFEPPPSTPPAANAPAPPAPLPEALPATLDFFPAGGRLDLTQFDAQLTSTDGDSHLLSFGEFAAMHLMVWSNVCWDESRWPEPATLAEAPGKVIDGGHPVHVHSPLDIALAKYLGPRWDAWNEALRKERDADLSHPPAERQARGAAGFMRNTWLGAHQGFDDFHQLGKFEQGLFGKFMTQMRARLLRALAERVGIAVLAQSSVVRSLGRIAMIELGETWEAQRKAGNPDVWLVVLDNAMKATGAFAATTWADFVKDSLALRREARDDPLEPGFIDQLVARWAQDLGGDATARDKAGYADLSRYAMARQIESLARGKEGLWDVYKRQHTHRERLQIFERGLPRVRRAMANVPTYMVFDDHDVTDDWNLNPLWVQRVTKDGTSLGRQIVRNALAAYALFQDWGNDPLRYEAAPGAGVLANAANLMGLATAASRPDAGAARALDTAFGLDKQPQPENPLEPNGRHLPVNAPMKFHFRIGGPKHLVVALDNRTRRSFVSRNGPPGNVAISMQADQIPAAPLPAGQELLIVLAPLQVLAPSVFDEIIAPASYRAFDLGRPASAGSKGRGVQDMAGTDPDAIEGWALDAITFEALLERLAPHKQVLLLSGDVHYSAATQMSYWKKGEALPARFVQFTSSGFKNVMPPYLVAIDHALAFAHEMIRSDIGGERMGWKLGATGAFDFPAGQDATDLPLVLRKRLRRQPAHLPTYGWPVDRSLPAQPQFTRVKAAQKPDFSWRLLPVFDRRADAERPPLAGPAAFVGTPPDAAKLAATGKPFEAYQQIAARHQAQFDRLGNSRQILFRSNFAQVRFERRSDTSGPAPRTVLDAVHEIYTAVPDPDSLEPKERAEPKLVSDPTPFAYVVQRASLTPDPAEPRPEDLPLKGGLAASIQG